ncbi:gamma carbonic anhydrase family protein [Bacillus dakarensis]|uniref:gamma carbonic anhydrase family protein n=1 Tax=Robertmurraya dakarensis TaxID=1926278 RepID=UPI0009FC87F6|nr:gamma carbonic anhydrase family protein [Bacillus dakarensis]
MIYSLKGKSPQIHSSVYLAPGSHVLGDIILEENVTVLFNAVIRAEAAQIRIGKGSNIQDNSTVHVDSGYPVNVGENCVVGHNVILHGCTVEDGCLIGMGATVMNGAVIGTGSIVAAGALVPEGKIIEPGVLVAGVPAKVVRKLSKEEIKGIGKGADAYKNIGRMYTEEGIFDK